MQRTVHGREIKRESILEKKEREREKMEKLLYGLANAHSSTLLREL